MLSRTTTPIATVMSIKLIGNNLLIFRKPQQINRAISTSKLIGWLSQRRGLKRRLMSSSPLFRKLVPMVSLVMNFSRSIRRDTSKYLRRTLARPAISSNPTIKTKIIRLVRKHNLPLWAHRITKRANQNLSRKTKIGFRRGTLITIKWTSRYICSTAALM